MKHFGTEHGTQLFHQYTDIIQETIQFKLFKNKKTEILAYDIIMLLVQSLLKYPIQYYTVYNITVLHSLVVITDITKPEKETM